MDLVFSPIQYLIFEIFDEPVIPNEHRIKASILVQIELGTPEETLFICSPLSWAERDTLVACL